MKWVSRLWPSKLKYRLFIAFLLSILIPFSLLQIYSYRNTEQLITRSVSIQTSEQLQLVKQSLEKLMSGVFLTMLQLERNEQLQQILQAPSAMDEQVRQGSIAQIIARQEMNTDGSQMYVHYMFADKFGHLYTSLAEGKYDYAALEQHSIYATLAPDNTYVWIKEDRNDLPPDISTSDRLLSLYNVLFDEKGAPYGYYRFIIDVEAWLLQLGRELLIHQKYAILNEAAQVVATTGDEDVLSLRVRQNTIDGARIQALSMGIEGQQLIGAVRIPQLDWTIVSQFPMSVYFGDLEAQRNKVFLTYFLLTGLFIAITFFLASTVTRPLYLLKRKLEEFVPNNLKATLPESAFRGEMQFLARSFNEMVTDIEQLIQRLKVEERQKEAVRFQMLLSQMNPHFLLNTLNVIKWNVLGKQDEETAEICVALAKLLETSLNVDKELIHLKHELDLVRAYVHIQNFRFEHRHQVIYEVPDSLLYTLVPKLCLQPLVENAYQHGFRSLRSGGLITVRVQEREKELVLEVENNGQPYELAALGQPPMDWGAEAALAWKKRPSIGLANIRERLMLLFREQGQLEIKAMEEQQGTRVRIVMPKLLSIPFEGGDEDVDGTGR